MDISRKIAEEVMGWSITRAPHPDILSKPVDCIETEVGVITMTVYGWNPSTDIAQAFQVVEKLRLRGYSCEIDIELDGSASVLFVGPDDSGLDGAPTLPEAICLAALATVNVSMYGDNRHDWRV